MIHWQDRAAPMMSTISAQRAAHVLALGLLLICTITLKTSIWELHPQIFNDSPSYLVPAIRLLDGRGYGVQEDGFRTPTFPLYLAALIAPFDRTHLNACTDAHRAVCIGRAAEFSDGQTILAVIVLANILLGCGITILLYALGWQLTRSYVAALLIGAGYALNIATAFWEISIMTETLTTFLVLTVVLLTLRAQKQNRWTSLALGLVLAILALCHALFLFFAPLPALYLLLRRWRAGWTRALRLIAPVVLIPLAAIGSWSAFNYFVNGAFTPSTVSGYVLIQTVYPVIQNAPEGYDGITQTLVGYRNAQIREMGKPTGAVFRAWRDMMKETDLTFTQVSGKLNALSLYLMWHYPHAYLQAVSESFAHFWDFAFFHYDPVPEGVARIGEVFANNMMQSLMNILFWLASLIVGVLLLLARRHARNPILREALWGVTFLTAIVWYAALVSSLTNLGDNARYRVTVTPLQYAAIVTAFWLLWQFLRSRRGAVACGKALY
jgi:4-amino-4-deoxy-L-arabinose transferase-like glycosyltransferase